MLLLVILACGRSCRRSSAVSLLPFLRQILGGSAEERRRRISSLYLLFLIYFRSFVDVDCRYPSHIIHHHQKATTEKGAGRAMST